MSEAASPLAQVDPTSLDELFARVNEKLITGLPESITDAEIAPLVDRLREQSLKFLLEGQMQPKKTARVKKAPATSVADALAAIADLDGDAEEA